jgi:hypothetical protein
LRELFFERGSSSTREPDPIGGTVVERGRQFFPAATDGIDVQACDQGDEPVPAVPNPGTLDGGVPASLLLIKPAGQKIHLPMNFLIGVGLQARAVGTLTSMDFLLKHGLALPNGT